MSSISTILLSVASAISSISIDVVLVESHSMSKPFRSLGLDLSHRPPVPAHESFHLFLVLGNAALSRSVATRTVSAVASFEVSSCHGLPVRVD